MAGWKEDRKIGRPRGSKCRKYPNRPDWLNRSRRDLTEGDHCRRYPIGRKSNAGNAGSGVTVSPGKQDPGLDLTTGYARN